MKNYVSAWWWPPHWEQTLSFTEASRLWNGHTHSTLPSTERRWYWGKELWKLKTLHSGKIHQLILLGNSWTWKSRRCDLLGAIMNWVSAIPILTAVLRQGGGTLVYGGDWVSRRWNNHARVAWRVVEVVFRTRLPKLKPRILAFRPCRWPCVDLVFAVPLFSSHFN